MIHNTATDMLAMMMQFYLMREIPGEDDNAIILHMFHDLGFDDIQDDETAWCAALWNYCAKQCGIRYKHGSLSARDALSVGIATAHPRVGDTVVFWRGDPASWQGHVGLFLGFEDDKIHVLGGNQSNQVNITLYGADKLLGFRRLQYETDYTV